jgi:hypothetical protein
VLSPGQGALWEPKPRFLSGSNLQRCHRSWPGLPKFSVAMGFGFGRGCFGREGVQSCTGTFPESHRNRCPRLEAAPWGTTAPAATACRALVATAAAPSRKAALAVRWASTPPAATASAAPVTSRKRFKRAARDTPWVGIHLVAIASKAVDACPAGSSMLQILLSCRAPERATAVPGPGEG